MLLRRGSPEPPAPCARCSRRAAGVRWGDLCPECLAELRRRASPLARIISLVFAGVVIGYAYWRIPLTPATRIWVAAIAVATYFLVRKITTGIAVELMRK